MERDKIREIVSRDTALSDDKLINKQVTGYPSDGRAYHKLQATGNQGFQENSNQSKGIGATDRPDKSRNQHGPYQAPSGTEGKQSFLGSEGTESGQSKKPSNYEERRTNDTSDPSSREEYTSRYTVGRDTERSVVPSDRQYDVNAYTDPLASDSRYLEISGRDDLHRHYDSTR